MSPPTDAVAIAIPGQQETADTTAAQKTALQSLSDWTKQNIAKQIKHYFTTANLNHDQYMAKQIKENTDGWVPFSTMVRFNKLRDLLGVPKPKDDKKKKQRQPAVPTQYVELLAAVVAEILKDDELVEVNEGKTQLRRKQAYEQTGAWFDKTVHAKGLEYGKETGELIDELTEAFGVHGEVALVRLRRNPKTKVFKGNALVEFVNKEDAEKVAKLEDFKFKETPLQLSMLRAYHDEKKQADEFIQPELRQPGETYPTFEEWCHSHGKPVPAPLNEKKQQQKRKPEEEEPKEVEVNIEPGTLVNFVIENNTEESVKPGTIRGKVAELVGAVRFVELERDATKGVIRFAEAVGEKAIADHQESGVAMDDGVVLRLSAVSEEEQNAFVGRAKAVFASAGRKGNNGRQKRRLRK